ncbi:unnamed protein product [Closterium sp. Naga37s-1]|nr:unnamed protein product [Closterium sp. Naga37s-1]
MCASFTGNGETKRGRTAGQGRRDMAGKLPADTITTHGGQDPSGRHSNVGGTGRGICTLLIHRHPVPSIPQLTTPSSSRHDMAGKLPEDAIATLEAQAEAAARAIVEKYMKKCAVADLDCDWKIAVGDEREVICREVMRVCADVLIVGTRGLSPVKK